ncbi:MAG: arginase family protein [Bdellovibrionaceae bacterium]|nr:arginase family protein [Pseudobdellovibrionaceae bacterium]
MSFFALPNKNLFFTKNDATDLRLGDVVTADLQWETISNSLVVIGYSDDRGIQANGGRIGAKEGPSGIRQILYKLVAQESFRNKIFDIGDFSTATDLANDQLLVIKTLEILNQNQNKILSFGGGHDWAYCDVSTFIQRELKQNRRPLVINVDAHLDVRSDKNGVNSGTPFFKIIEKFSTQFDLVQIGIQPHCNSEFHLNYARQNNVQIFMKDDIESQGMKTVLNSLVSAHFNQPVFLSLDIDAITASEAPGCSQSWPGGLSFNSVKALLDGLQQFPIWNHLGIYEVSPPLDVQSVTQKSAALAAYTFITHALENHGV